MAIAEDLHECGRLALGAIGARRLVAVECQPNGGE